MLLSVLRWPAAAGLLAAAALPAQEVPVLPEPLASPTTLPTPQPVSSSAPTPAPTSTSRSNPAPKRQPLPAPRLKPTIVPAAAPTRAPIKVVVLPPRQPDDRLWALLLGGGGLAFLLLGWANWRRGSGADVSDEAWVEAPLPPSPLSLPETVVAPDPAQLTFEVRATRAGLNLISVTVQVDVAITNGGSSAAHDVCVELRLASAHDGRDAYSTAVFSAPVMRPATPPFTLHQAERHQFSTVAAIAHEAIEPMEANGRQMFVPLLALCVRYEEGGETRQVLQSYLVGVERGGSNKLAPLWLDTPPRTYERVALRPHGGPLGV